MLVSVIIPNFNHAHYLNLRVTSVLNQTYKNFEVIILDDCSIDNSRQLLEEYRNNPKISHLYFNERNSGSTFNQWKKGIELAKGDWIWIAESDDWCEPTLLEELIAGVNNETCLAYTQSVIVSDNKVIGLSKEDFLAIQYDGKDFVNTKMLSRNSVFNASMCIFRKSCFSNVGAEFTTFKFCGDWLFWIEVALQGNVFVSGKVLNYFRKHDKDVTGKQFVNGNFYVEYLQLVKTLHKKGIISEAKMLKLVADQYYRLLRDSRVQQSFLPTVKLPYRQELGMKYRKVELGRLKEKFLGK